MKSEKNKGYITKIGIVICVGSYHQPKSNRMKIAFLDGQMIPAPGDAKVGDKYEYTTHRMGYDSLEKIECKSAIDVQA